MNIFQKTSVAITLTGAALFMVATQVHGAVTPLVTPLQDYRTECVTGTDGKQVCTTVLIERTASPSAQKATSTPVPTPITVGSAKDSTATEMKTTAETEVGTASTKHKIVNTGIEENIMVALFAMFLISSVGYTYSKINV